MAELPSWGESSTVVGIAGLLTGAAAVIKTLFDACRDSGKNRHDAESDIRDDLRAEIERQGAEILILRRELAESRVEIRLITERANADVAYWREKALSFQAELAEVRAALRVLQEQNKSREHTE